MFPSGLSSQASYAAGFVTKGSNLLTQLSTDLFWASYYVFIGTGGFHTRSRFQLWRTKRLAARANKYAVCVYSTVSEFAPPMEHPVAKEIGATLRGFVILLQQVDFSAQMEGWKKSSQKLCHWSELDIQIVRTALDAARVFYERELRTIANLDQNAKDIYFQVLSDVCRREVKAHKHMYLATLASVAGTHGFHEFVDRAAEVEAVAKREFPDPTFANRQRTSDFVQLYIDAAAIFPLFKQLIHSIGYLTGAAEVKVAPLKNLLRSVEKVMLKVGENEKTDRIEFHLPSQIMYATLCRISINPTCFSIFTPNLHCSQADPSGRFPGEYPTNGFECHGVCDVVRGLILYNDMESMRMALELLASCDE